MLIKGGNRNAAFPSTKGTLISLLVVTYNSERDLRACIQSIINQRFKNIELLIFDGNSTDNTIKILKEYDDYISYWQSEPDDGIYAAMNKAVKYATGQFIYFLGSDDVLLDGFSEIASQLNEVNTLYYGHCFRENIQTGGAMNSYKLARFNICHHAIFYPALVFKKYSFNTKYVVYADHALHIQLWGDRSIKKQYLPYAVANYGAHGFSTWTRDEAFRKDKLALIKKHLSLYTYIRYLKKLWTESRKNQSDFF